ncbi:hypothetical protein HMPREF9120_02118 [Neisseria sp. oral taxon 020 str. F0370]|nr:hypothetical protein HMPREF9120_02118 [Neisseria sp. oral taxon 020 str. F0370]
MNVRFAGRRPSESFRRPLFTRTLPRKTPNRVRYCATHPTMAAEAV